MLISNIYTSISGFITVQNILGMRSFMALNFPMQKSAGFETMTTTSQRQPVEPFHFILTTSRHA